MYLLYAVITTTIVSDCVRKEQLTQNIFTTNETTVQHISNDYHFFSISIGDDTKYHTSTTHQNSGFHFNINS